MNKELWKRTKHSGTGSVPFSGKRLYVEGVY
jgi:hypothetical protein